MTNPSDSELYSYGWDTTNEDGHVIVSLVIKVSITRAIIPVPGCPSIKQSSLRESGVRERRVFAAYFPTMPTASQITYSYEFGKSPDN